MYFAFLIVSVVAVSRKEAECDGLAVQKDLSSAGPENVFGAHRFNLNTTLFHAQSFATNNITII